MPRGPHSPLDPLHTAPDVRAAAAALLDAVAEETGRRSLSPVAYERALAEIARLRGRPLFLPALAAGAGDGARVRLADGRSVLDFIGGIGVYGLGHGDRDLLETAVIAAARDAVFQGHLLPGPEYRALSRALRRHAGPRLRHVWLSVSGAMANENALKLIFQKHHPADRVLAFDGAFAGRTTTLAELTDKPAFRDGLPLRGFVDLVPFHDPDDPGSQARSLAALDAHLTRHPGRHAAMLFELVQGEGGVRTAPPAFFAALMERCRAAGLAVWVDEVQTFGRTGEVFAFRTLGLEDQVDVVTAGKLLQGSAVLFRKAYNPRPGLIAGTYAGSTVGMAVGARILERLESEGWLGPDGGVARLGHRVEGHLARLRERLPRAVGRSDGIGAMHAFTPWDGDPETVKRLLQVAFEEGLLAFAAGSRPTRVRLLLPVNVRDDELDAGFTILEKAMGRVAEERGLPC